jgi:trehalose 6-phosphate phosphatase
MANYIGDLPHALAHGDELVRRLAGKVPAVFLDYDGTLTPIVDRPEDAVISQDMRNAVRQLAERCPVCVVSGRDRRVVQELMGFDDLIVAGSHGFDIWSPEEGTIEREEGVEFEALLAEVKARLHEEIDPIEGALIEPKKTSVAAHYRLVPEEEQPRIKEVVDTMLADYPDELKVIPGKMVYEILFGRRRHGRVRIRGPRGPGRRYLRGACRRPGGVRTDHRRPLHTPHNGRSETVLGYAGALRLWRGRW